MPINTLFVTKQHRSVGHVNRRFYHSCFCLKDEEMKKVLKGKKLRERGLAPGLSDSEVITMEIVGEFLGKDCDKAIWEYFKSHWLHFFPKIPDRSNFVRQAANLHSLYRLSS